jgi:hypothetical protein
MSTNHREHRKCLFDDITALFRDVKVELEGLMDAGSTAEQRRAVGRAQKALCIFEQTVIKKLRKKMEV